MVLALAAVGCVPPDLGTTPTSSTVPPGRATVVVSGSGQVSDTAQTYPAPLVARVVDSTGAPIPGVTVRFASTPMPSPRHAGVSFPSGSTAVSDVAGLAQVAVAADEWVGDLQVTATVDDQTGSVASFALRQRIGRRTGEAAVPSGPVGPVFDGANIWVAQLGTDTVSKLRARDGALIGTYTVGSSPDGLAYDGANIWVANCGTDDVMRLNPDTGAVEATFPVPGCPSRVLPVGDHIWVAGKSTPTLRAINASTGATVRTATYSGGVEDFVYDGTDIWITETNGHPLARIRESDGSTVSTTGFSCTGGIALQGDSIWVADPCLGKVTRLRRADEVNLGDFPVGLDPLGVVTDGNDVWVSNYGSASVTRVRAADGLAISTTAVPTGPLRMAFDGTNVWVASISGSLSSI